MPPIDAKAVWTHTGIRLKAGMTYRFSAHGTWMGELTCFANDLRGFYFNNSGAVTLTVEEVRT